MEQDKTDVWNPIPSIIVHPALTQEIPTTQNTHIASSFRETGETT